jgi:uncharacterized protein (TIGR02145 family)
MKIKLVHSPQTTDRRKHWLLAYIFFLLTVHYFLLTTYCFSQGVSINTTENPADNSAILDVSSTAQGLLIPRMTTNERNNIASAAISLLIFNTTTNCFEYYVNGIWYTFSCPGACTAPAIPTAGINTPSQTQIVWNWNTTDGATGYQWNTSNSYPGVGVNTTVSTLYAQTGLTCNTAYTLYVWAYNTCGNSSYVTLTQTTSTCICSYVCQGDGAFNDTRDGQTYGYVNIGTQTWMCQNMNYSDNGTYTPLANGQGATGIQKYCYNDNPDNCCIYGGLYEWNEFMNGAAATNNIPSGVQGICPNGWHIPSDAEWCIMENYVESGTDPGCNIINGNRGVSTGGKLKEDGTIHWISPNVCGGTCNTTRFTALPGGLSSSGSFSGIGQQGYFLTTSEYNSGCSCVMDRIFGNDYAYSHRGVYGGNKSYGASVRCVQN